MINLIISNSDVTVYINGTMHRNSNLDKNSIEQVKNLSLEYSTTADNERQVSIQEEVINIMKPNKKDTEKKISYLEEKVEQEEQKEKIKANLAFDYPKIFTVKDGQVFLKGFESVVMPENLVKKIITCIQQNEPVESFVNFWKLALMNPNPKAREGLFKYIQLQNLIITQKGYFVCYRKANKVSDGSISELQKYCTAEIIRLRQSKLPITRYSIGELDGKFVTLDHRTSKYTNFTGKIHGVVKDLMENFKFEKKDILTDNHSGRMRFSLGDVVKQDRDKCDSNPNNECSNGLHVGTPSYIRGNEWAGQVYMMVFVNPMHVVSVPYRDAYKMRVCEYYVSAILNSLEDITSIDSSKITVFEDEYCNYELKQFDDYLVGKKFDFEKYESLDDNRKAEFKTKLEELRKDIHISKDFISNDISMEEVRRIINSRT